MAHPQEKVEAAIAMLKAQGHVVEIQVRGDKGNRWYQIDDWMLVSWEEMQDLADGVYSLTELEGLFIRREVERASEHPDELAQGVIAEWHTYFELGHADTLPPEFKELKDRAFEYLNAKENLDNHRKNLRLVRQRTDEPVPDLDALLEQAASHKRAAREVLLKAYRDLLEKKRLLRAAKAKAET